MAKRIKAKKPPLTNSFRRFGAGLATLKIMLEVAPFSTNYFYPGQWHEVRPSSICDIVSSARPRFTRNIPPWW
jgi:hypothetical protein